MVWVHCEFRKNRLGKVSSAVCRFCTETKCKVPKTLPRERISKHDKSQKEVKK